MGRVVLDASALLILLNDEPGAEEVAGLLPDAVLGAVNLAEVVGKLVDAGVPHPEARSAVEILGLEIVPLDRDLAHAAGALRGRTKGAGLSLGDRACLALAAHLGAPAVTADAAWAKVRSGAKVKVVRRDRS